MTKKIKISLDYLAGLIDGEGFFTINFRKIKQSEKGTSYEYIPVIGIHMTATKLMKQIQVQFGGHIHQRMGTNRVRSDWNLRQAKIIYPFLKKIYPYLKVKHSQARLMMDLCETYTFYTKKKYSKLPSELISYRNKIKKEITKLNLKQA